MNKAWTKIGRVFMHYNSGLLQSCWKAGIHAIKINGGIALASAAAPKLLAAPDLKMMSAIFVTAAFWQAIDYFDANPLPDFADVVDPHTPAIPALPPSMS